MGANSGQQTSGSQQAPPAHAVGDNSIGLASSAGSAPVSVLPAAIGASKLAAAQAAPQAAPQAEPKVQLRRSLNLWNGVSVILGVIIGSGIFVSPRGVLAESGSVGASLLVWTLCGLLALLGSLCFVELGTSISTSGGEYTYIRLAYGPLPSFLYLWVLVSVIMPCSNAVTALTFANYVLQPLYLGCPPPEHAIRLLALAILSLLVYINCASVKGSIRLQNSFSLAKFLAFVLIISFGLYYLASGHSSALANFGSSGAIWAGTQTSLPHLAMAFYSAFYTYSGWSALNCVTEEMKDPVRNMPRAIILSIVTITLIYILTNVAYFAVLSKPEMLGSDAIAVIFGERTMHFAQWLMPLTVALSTMGGLNASIFAASRVLFAGAREGQLFSGLQMIHSQHLTPIPSLIFLGLISALYLVTTEIQVLINYMTFVEASFAALAVSTVLRLRHKLPQLERPFRVPLLVPLLYLAFSFLLIVLPIWTAPVQTLVGVVIMLTGVPVYYATARWNNKPANYQRAIDTFNAITQKLTLSVAPTQDIKIE